MSITPAMESSEYQFQRVDEEPQMKKKGAYSRQGSFGSSQDESACGQNDPAVVPATAQAAHKDTLLNNRNSLAKKIVGNIYFQIFITILTIISLILYDIKTIACTKQQDFAIGIANCIFFSIFMIEIVMNTKNEGYFCSFFFYLDLISTVTILFDVDFVVDALFNQSSNFQVSSFVAKSKASRVAARAVRIVKIFRLARVAKLYKSAQKAKQLNQKQKLDLLEKLNNKFKHIISHENQNSGINNDESNQNLLSRSCLTRKNVHTTNSNLDRYYIENDSIKQEPIINNQKASYFLNQKQRSLVDNSQFNQDEEDQQVTDLQAKESQISKILTEDTVKKIVIIILLIMMEIPLLNINNYQNISTQWDFTTTFIANSLLNPNITMDSINQLIQRQIDSVPQSDIEASFICIDSPFNEISTCGGFDFSEYRTSDLGTFTQSINSSAVIQVRPNLTLQSVLNSQNTGDLIIIFMDYSSYNSIDAGFSIATTIFICLTIIYLLGSFSDNINDLVIIPIEKMLALVRAKDFRQQESKQQNQERQEQYETRLVQQAIVKIKDLMETIFGPLGNDFVQETMLNHKSISANLMDSIKQSFCVVSVCRVNHLSKITEFLGEDIFGFTNQIALIVHNAAFRYGGYCTKILDNGFLIIFKIPESQIQKYNIQKSIDPIALSKYQNKAQQSYINNFCDFSLYFALKALARLVKESKLFKYKNNQNLLKGFGGVFSIEMNFAFTMGWCNEAIVGSTHKIDPIFLGKEINDLEKILHLSKNYHSSILVSQSLYANISNGLRRHIRPFDVIKFDERQPQRTLYFVDYDATNVAPSRNMAQKAHKETKDIKTKKSMNMIFLSGLLKGNSIYSASSFIGNKKELSQILRKTANDDTRKKKYEVAFDRYLKGEWGDSQQFLQSQNLKSDIPTQRLYNFVQSQNFKAPANWKGYRFFSDLF